MHVRLGGHRGLLVPGWGVADFEVLVTAGAVVETWEDPAVVGEHPSRLNSHPGYPARRWVGKVGQEVELTAVVAGVSGPPDSALAGRLFVTWFVERPWPPQWITHDLGRTSVQRFTPNQPGHYTVGFRRPDGGAVHVHLDITEN